MESNTIRILTLILLSQNKNKQNKQMAKLYLAYKLVGPCGNKFLSDECYIPQTAEGKDELPPPSKFLLHHAVEYGTPYWPF